MTAFVNRFAGTCPLCKQRISPEQGATIKDAVTGKWMTFCIADLPEEYGEIKASVPFFRRRDVAYAGQSLSTTTTGPTVAPPQTNVLPVATSVKAGRGTTARIVVFSGPIHSRSDGDVHLITAQTVLELHGINPYHPPDCTITFIDPVDKQFFRPQPDDFVIGPRFTTDEYEQAATDLLGWLLKKGITR